MTPPIEALARRVHELHRARDARRSRVRIAAWDELDAATRARLVAAYARVRAAYDVGRAQPREVRITAGRPG